MDYPISIFIDTNIFDGCKYHLDDNGVLSILEKMVENGKVKLYISNIVLREAQKHIRIATEKTYRSLKKAENESRNYISPSLFQGTPIERYFQLPQSAGIEESALSKFLEYLERINAIVLDNTEVDIEQIVNDYFNNKPPFEEKEIKKNEFPDAIIISKLKKEFSESNPIWIISGDKGFQAAFQGLAGFYSINNLKNVFDEINKNDRLEIYNKITTDFKKNDIISEIVKGIEQELNNDIIEVDGMDCDRSGYCEGFEYVEVYTEDSSVSEVVLSSIDEVTDQTVIVSVISKANFRVICSYDDYENSVGDSEEKEYLFLERRDVRELHHAEFVCVLRFSISGTNNNMRFELEEVYYELELDQYTRISREFLESEKKA